MHKCLILLLLAALPLGAQEIPPEFDFQRILVPITTFQTWQGAYGTDWRAELSIRNSSDEAIHIFANYNSNFCISVPILCPGGKMLPPQSMAGFGWQGLIYPSGGEGAFFYIPRDDKGIFLNLLLFERSFGHQSEGVEIPLVRESEMLNGPIELLNISTSSSSRRLLRVYAAAPRPPDPTMLSEVLMRVAVYPLDGEDVLAEFLLSLPVRHPMSSLPQYAEAQLNVDEWPLLATAERIRVRVEPASHAEVPYWAFVSVTDNTTQHVTIISPQ